MNSLIKAPFVVLGFSLIVMWLAARIGLFFRKRQNVLEEGTHEDFDLVVGAILTLLGLIIGLSFSDSRRVKQGVVKMLVIPLVLSIAFLAIADIDSPRRGVIRVVPQNLISFAESLNRH